MLMNRRSLYSALLIVTVAILTVYGQVVTFGFVDYDDFQYVTRNPVVARGLTPEGMRWAFTTLYASNWHPLTWLSHMLDVQLFGMNPAGHHGVNLLLHLANSLLLLLALARMTGALRPSLLVALLFALHPLHVESVAYVAERKDLLSTFFFMLVLLAYHAYVQAPGVRRHLVLAALLTLGLLAKPMLVTLPFVLLLLDFWPLRRVFPHPHGEGDGMTGNSVGPLLLEKVPLLLLVAGSSVITYVAQDRGGSVSHGGGINFVVQAGNACISYLSYLGKTVWPQNLAVFYPFNPAAVTFTRVGLALGVLLLISWVMLRSWQRLPFLAVGWLWYLGMLVPVIGFVQVGGQAMADRYTYLPLIGIFIIVAWGVEEVAVRWRLPDGVVLAGCCFLLICLGLASWRQAGSWRDSFTLFSRAAAVTSGNWLAHHNLGTAYIDRGEPDEALRHLREALRIRPDYASAANNIGNVYFNLGRRDDALHAYREAMVMDPDFVPARRNLVRALLRWGFTDLARKESLILRELAPDEADKVPVE
jgi:hypothetical protein